MIHRHKRESTSKECIINIQEGVKYCGSIASFVRGWLSFLQQMVLSNHLF